MASAAHIREKFEALRCCVIVPTYNNAGTLSEIIAGVLKFTDQVIVVNDGSTDDTVRILDEFPTITHLQYPENQGKGHALQQGFSEALKQGYQYAISIDSDGQHDPADLPRFLEAIEEKPGSLIVGARNMDQEGIPGGSSFGHRFSNFWVKVETGISLPDTQSGYRLYPIERLKDMRFFTSRYEFEIEVLVRAAWRGIPLEAVPISVYYPPEEERVSHFRPYVDFLRVSLVNTFLVILAFLWFRPRNFFRGLKKKPLRQIIRENLLQVDEPPIRKAMAIALGLFMGIFPIWGYQTVAAIGLAYVLRLNQALVFLAVNISLPPVIPVILYLSYQLGAYFIPVTGQPLSLENISMAMIKANMIQYLTGSVLLAVLTALAGGLIAFVALQIISQRRAKEQVDS